MLNDRELDKDIDEAFKDNKEKRGPRHIEFYIKHNQEAISRLTLDNQRLQQDNVFFKGLLLRNGKDTAVKCQGLDILKVNNETIKSNEAQIKLCQERIAEFESLKEAYAEDARRGLYYNKNTGEIINEEPLTEEPEEAFLANQKGGV